MKTKSLKTEKATKRLIDSVWTLEFRRVAGADRLIEVVNYSRDDKDGYERALQLPKLKTTENSDRILTHAEIDGKTYAVQNPQHVFSYHTQD